MIGTDNIQSIFLDEIKKRLPSNISLADELAAVLNISRDSAYRRIRGDTVLSLDESKVLCRKFGVSLDKLITTSGDLISFLYRGVDTKNSTFNSWLKSTLTNLEGLLRFPDREIIYLANNIPLAYYFNFPLLGMFKIFFWTNSLWNREQAKNIKFETNLFDDELITNSKRFWQLYTDMPRTEIWCQETAVTTLRQIEFYNESGFFMDTKIAAQLCEEYLKLIQQIRRWASIGYKDYAEHSISLFKNDLILPDATILYKMGNKRTTILPCNTMDVLTTSDDNFCKKTEEYLNNVISKSNLISTSGEKDRNKFFNQIEEKILQTKSRLQ